MLGTVMATCSILQSVIKYAKPAVSIYPVVKNNWQPTPATNRFFGPTISKAERDKRDYIYMYRLVSMQFLFDALLNTMNDNDNRI